MSAATEIAAIEQAHRAAQARLGLAAAYLSLKEWGGVNATSAAGTGDAWAAATLRMITVLRSHSRGLATTYYQLVRALDTGYTLGMPEGVEDEDAVTLKLLRDRFTDSVVAVADLGTGTVHRDGPDDVWFEQLLSGADTTGADQNARSVLFDNTDLSAYLDRLLTEYRTNNTVVGVDRFDWPADMTADQVAVAFEDMLRREALEAQASKVKKHGTNQDLTHEQYLERIVADHDRSGSRGAGVADWASVSSGRDQIAYAGRRDKRVRAVARGTGTNPCYWCAMLASRGFAYVSAGSAGFGAEDVSKWHLNCHCYPIVRFVTSAEVPEQSKFYAAKWKTVTAGYSGEAKTKAWRKWFAQQRAANKP